MSVATYLTSVNQRYQTGISREHSYRTDLETLLRQLVTDVQVTNEPANVTDCGNPDFVITRRHIPIGYIEAKDIGKNLNSKQYRPQFERYKKALDNLIITDYLWFQFFQQGELVQELRIGQVMDNRVQPQPERFAEFEARIQNFCTFVGQTIHAPQKLAEMMAAKARLLQTILENALTADEASPDSQAANSALQEQFQTFQKILIHDLTPAAFADIYAQTLAYGMFAARLHDTSLDTFTRQEAAELIPHSNPFLRKLFQHVAGYDIDPRIRPTVDNLAEVFRATDVEALLTNFGSSTQQTDPVIHFYETFLAEYDPALRKSRGVWYTPEPVVNFIVRAVDDLLKREFKLPLGLADTSKTRIRLRSQTPDKRSKSGFKEIEQEIHKVQILDPATGTGTFLAEIIRQIYQRQFKAMQGGWSRYVEDDLIPRLNGFELLMASYAMAHLKLDMLLTETGYRSSHQPRLNIYLTNSLEEHHPDTGTLFASWLSQEASEANRIKRDTPVMVVLGNPPYSGESANKGAWIMALMDDYKKEPGGQQKLQERNSKWINDDYVKFLRYGQYLIEKNGEGILAFINPHGFLDNPTFRGMRWHLLRTYDQIYTIDLHGNSKKKETAPDGGKDENVFDIQQGVSINLLVKTGRKKANQLGQLFHYDLYGEREGKYRFLWEHTLDTVPYNELPNVAPDYFFVEKDFEAQKKYQTGFSVTDLFPTNSVGVVTARDAFTIHDSRAEVKQLIQEFVTLDPEAAREKYELGRDVRDWRVHWAQEDLRNSGLADDNICQISYRPFDDRWTYYTGHSRGFHCMPRGEVMQHFFKKNNVGLVIPKVNKEDDCFFISKNIIGHKLCSAYDVNYLFPLYLYPDDTQQSFLDSTRTPNLEPEIVKTVAAGLGLRYTPESEPGDDSFAPLDLLDYIYAVLHDPGYRATYVEFLKIDFPRVPYPSDPARFWALVRLGSELRQLHLLESPLLAHTERIPYPADGDNRVTRRLTKTSPGFIPTGPATKLGRVWINDQQYFADVPEAAWNFYIGGYQPAQKWLKDRRGRVLSFADLRHYQQIIIALIETERLMGEIEAVTPEWGSK